MQRLQGGRARHGQRALPVLPVQDAGPVRHVLHRRGQEVAPALVPARVPPPLGAAHVLRRVPRGAGRRLVRVHRAQRLRAHHHVHVLLRERAHAGHLVEALPDAHPVGAVRDHERAGLPHVLAPVPRHAAQDPAHLSGLRAVALLAVRQLLRALLRARSQQKAGQEEPLGRRFRAWC
ncbi:hypothetical protein ON010_g16927 [Phytophthora cinnamomi]|nr:hypothetical protein ON010_g16927 [Phytophthora cinnamomi]